MGKYTTGQCLIYRTDKRDGATGWVFFLLKARRVKFNQKLQSMGFVQ